MSTFPDRVASYAESVLRPTALEADRDDIDADRIHGLGDIGLLNHLAPTAYGGQGIDVGSDRRVAEILSGACPNTWLVWTQHATQVGRIAEAFVASEGTVLPALVEDILRGRRLAGAALSDVRRYPERYISATRSGTGWRFDGTVSWVSGWGIFDVLTVAAADPDTGDVVTALVPVDEQFAAAPLRLAALNGSRTRRVQLNGVHVDEENVLSVQSREVWREWDRGIATDAKPHHFGIAEAVLDELSRDEDALARHIADRWRPAVSALREEAYGLTDEAVVATAAGEQCYRLADRLSLKVAASDAVTTLTGALLTARAGHGLVLEDTAQLYARAALFVQIQGQNYDVRRAQLERHLDPPTILTITRTKIGTPPHD